MKKLFVTKELVTKLIELGFNEECVAVWDNQTDELFINDTRELNVNDLPTIFTVAPLYQQAMTFLSPLNDGNPTYRVIVIKKTGNYSLQKWNTTTEGFEFYSDGTNEDCIRKLIEVIEESKS